MSRIINRMLAFVAGMLLMAAIPAVASAHTAADTLRCTTAWASDWAKANGTTEKDAMRYARRIQIDPPTTLRVNGSDYRFDTPGQTVWNTCEASLRGDAAPRGAHAATPVTNTAASPAATSTTSAVRQSPEQASAHPATLADDSWFSDRARAMRTIGLIMGVLAFAAIACWFGRWLVTRPARARRGSRKPEQIGPQGEHTPSAVHDPGFDDPDIRSGP